MQYFSITEFSVPPLSSSSQKDLWWDKLTGIIKQERRANPSSTNIQLGYFDQATNFEHVSQIERSVWSARGEARVSRIVQFTINYFFLLRNGYSY